MGKIIIFILGLIGGIALCAVLYLQASEKYNTAQNISTPGYAASEMKTAQLLWPPYIMDKMFQDNLLALNGTTTPQKGQTVTIYIIKGTPATDVEELMNQIEVMDGVTSVVLSTLDDPTSYIENLTKLPQGKEYVVDYITVTTNSSVAAREVADITEVQEFIFDVIMSK